VKETTRQSSQDGLLAHVDKVSMMTNNKRLWKTENLYYFSVKFKVQAKEKIKEEEEKLLAPLEQVRSFSKSHTHTHTHTT